MVSDAGFMWKAGERFRLAWSTVDWERFRALKESEALGSEPGPVILCHLRGNAFGLSSSVKGVG